MVKAKGRIQPFIFQIEDTPELTKEEWEFTVDELSITGWCYSTELEAAIPAEFRNT